MREKIGVVFGSPNITPGGKALKFFASTRLETSLSTAKKQSITGATHSMMGKKEKERLGSVMRAKCVKNKGGMPFLDCEVPLYYGKGMDLVIDWYEFAVNMGHIQKGKGAYKLPAKKTKKRANHHRVPLNKLEEYLPELQKLLEPEYA